MSERIVCNEAGGELREEIVRCRDCIYFEHDELGEYCTLMDFQVIGMADGFCAWGKRGEDTDERNRQVRASLPTVERRPRGAAQVRRMRVQDAILRQATRQDAGVVGVSEQNGPERTRTESATDELLRLLDERGVKWIEHEAIATDCVAFFDGCAWHDCWESLDGEVNVTFSMPPDQAVEATLGRCGVEWDGDVLVLTLPRDPSSIHVRRADDGPRKVYPSEATLGRGECHIRTCDNLNELGCDVWLECDACHWQMDYADAPSMPLNFCPNCGRRVVE